MNCIEQKKSDTLDFSPKTRPKSQSFKDFRDLVLRRNIRKRSMAITVDAKSCETDLFQLNSSAFLGTHPRTRSFLWDFRKFFSKNKTSVESLSTKLKSAQNIPNIDKYSCESVVVKHRGKSQSWSHYEAQNMRQKLKKTTELREVRTSSNIYLPVQQLQSDDDECVNEIISKIPRHRNMNTYEVRSRDCRFLIQSHKEMRRYIFFIWIHFRFRAVFYVIKIKDVFLCFLLPPS
ncbi:unnamed protein product [Thelazia callipaeda]|uniref:Uncharacterized protein n=1 Tax=Thelazia callipaeda TaxID=103827 RepID=A0A0N5CJ67_THECL|nr:unnamed protein product [Thelazia callipaeda]